MGILPDWAIERDVKVEPFKRQQSPPGLISWGLGSYGLDLRLGYRLKLFTPTHCTEVDPKNFDERAFIDVDLTPKIHDWKEVKQSMRDDVKDYQCSNCLQVAPGGQEPAIELCPGVEQPEEFVRIPPNSFALGEALEWIEIPRDCVGLCLAKSTYARVGIVTNATVIEPSWSGILTLEISNTSPLPARVYPGEGIVQIVLFRTDGYRESLKLALEHLVTKLASEPGMPEEISTPAYHALDILSLGHGKTGQCKVSYAERKGRYQGQTDITLPFVEQENKTEGTKP